MHCSQDLGPVVQSVVSLTSLLRVISLSVLADSIYNILIFFAEKMWVAYSHFFSKKFQHICVSLDVNFNASLTNDVVSFEQLGPGLHQISFRFYSKGHNSRKGDKYIRQEKKMCQIFLEEIHIWNFKTLACRVLDKRTMHNLKPIWPSTSLKLGAKNICFSYIFLQENICCGTY